jgi:hypothetical protein
MAYEKQVSLAGIEQHFKAEAYKQFLEIVRRTNPHATQPEYRTYLLTTTDGYYEVRNIKIHVFMGTTEGIPFQNFVFILNEKAVIEHVHFSIEEHIYQNIIEEGKRLEDLAYREKILHFIEIYRTAYNKKDLAFIEKTLSEDALIIVGFVIKSRKQDLDYIKHSSLGDEKIEFIRLGKQDYLKRLRKVFKGTDFIKVQFDEVNIQRHPNFEKIYGVQLKQRWDSSFYNDEGYLFLMVDFIREEEPIIHVRAWQPDKFVDGSTISIYDFEIIE